MPELQRRCGIRRLQALRHDTDHFETVGQLPVFELRANQSYARLHRSDYGAHRRGANGDRERHHGIGWARHHWVPSLLALRALVSSELRSDLRRHVALAVLLIAIVIVGCGQSEGGGGGDGNDSSLACDHFRNVAYDVSRGLLTDREMREKLKEVYDNASIATPRIRSAAEKMLAGATSYNIPRLRAGIREMDAACDQAGY